MIAHQKHEAAPLLSVRGLCVRFGNGSEAVAALRNLSFDLGKEKLGIVGESGSGKSTLGRAILKLLPRMATLSADRLDFCGSDIGKATERQMLQIRGRQIGLILQDPKYALDPTMKIGDQIGEAVTLHLGKRGKDKKNHVLEILDSVKIRDPQRVYKLYPHQISGGMGQRIMIAMTLVAQPKIIIADEPTSALDVTVRRQLLELLDELVTARGIGLIFITHDLGLAEGFCDRLLIMYSGQILEELPASSLSNAKHPYTRGLLESMPRLETPTERLSVLVRDPAWQRDVSRSLSQ
ncbi:peptide/nickel transport system ATP-binding protein [Phyllobacterium sp. 1468]|uniref:ABC transporter ATP-binding protein n=1 Tax=Phyllobacterium sp. 1468 TaxID=2817759 RepID=UPI0028630FAB|nr:ABC transporter ATP-binding protein [Phyllobacterium sp. 1468]MDR6635600.1 peptide/nickel transport system ATP-binding protein [Phyllobacterium sp. 1468]